MIEKPEPKTWAGAEVERLREENEELKGTVWRWESGEAFYELTRLRRIEEAAREVFMYLDRPMNDTVPGPVDRYLDALRAALEETHA